ncbi:hypothetical protein AB0G02_38265, partial [Actinosynnema sp. NPDC023658]|uniref:hypothetical protein n=1 Tax=Actinosynnema sp. NPDC023658 TaxID=3155465 RepID=UPI0033F530BE
MFEHDVEFDVQITTFSRPRSWGKLVPGSPFRRLPEPRVVARTGNPDTPASPGGPRDLPPIRGQVHLWLDEGSTTTTDPAGFRPGPPRTVPLPSTADIASLLRPGSPRPHHGWEHVEAVAHPGALHAAVLRVVDEAADGDTSLTAPGTDSRRQLDFLVGPNNLKANLGRMLGAGLVHNGLRYDRRVTDRVGAVGIAADLARPRLVSVSDTATSENSVTGGSYAGGMRAITRAFDWIANVGGTVRPNTEEPRGLGGSNLLLRWMPWLRSKFGGRQAIGLLDRNRVTSEGARTALVQWDATFSVVAESREANTLHAGAVERRGVAVELPGGVFTRVSERTAVELGLLPDVEPAPDAAPAPQVEAEPEPRRLQPPRALAPGEPSTLGLGLLEPERSPDLTLAVWDLVEQVRADRGAGSGHPLFPTSVLDDAMSNLQRLVDLSAPAAVNALVDGALDGGVPLLLHKPGRGIGKDVYQVTLKARLEGEARFLDVVNDGVKTEHAVVAIRKKIGGTARGSGWNALLRVPGTHASTSGLDRPADSVGVLPTAGVGGGSRNRDTRTGMVEAVRVRGAEGPMARYDLPIRFELVV